MDSPLSNHHPCSLSIWGKDFNCSEQAYFAKKAEMCKDDQALGNIMKATNPGTQKFHGGKIISTPDWEKSKVAIMEQVCTNKFQQNPHLADFLLRTNQTFLAEDNPSDGYWGIQMSRHSPRSKNRANFKLNHMGTILMSIRDNLRASTSYEASTAL
jgi:hypothetical protein